LTAAPTEITVADIGGTHARFALARIAAGRVLALGEATTLRVADHASLPAAWRAFAALLGRAPPRAAAFAVACPVRGDVLKFTNNPWTFRRAALTAEIGVERLIFINDFGAVGHAVAQAGAQDLIHIAGPRRPLPRPGIVSILGPGTGLGVAQLLLDPKSYRVVETEGGHVDFAPQDAFEDDLLQRLRRQFSRVSIERLISGSGLAQIRAALPGAQDAPVFADNRDLWAAAISGADPLARAALERYLGFQQLARGFETSRGSRHHSLLGHRLARSFGRLARMGLRLHGCEHLRDGAAACAARFAGRPERRRRVPCRHRLVWGYHLLNLPDLSLAALGCLLVLLGSEQCCSGSFLQAIGCSEWPLWQYRLWPPDASVAGTTPFALAAR